MPTDTRKVDAIIFRQDLYPRTEQSASTVQKYAEDLEVLPPIEINQLNELIDGWHRWTAHKKRDAETISVIVTETRDDAELLLLAIERNSQFGWQLSRSDKMAMARRVYRSTPMEGRGQIKNRLAEILSMSYATVNKWLGRIDKDEEESRNVAVLDLWLRCFTQEEIEAAIGATRDIVRAVLGEIEKFEIPPIPSLFTEDQPDDSSTEAVKSEWEAERAEKIAALNQENASHAAEFKVPIYNVWKQQEKSEGSEHFGNSEIRWVDNLLYLYTSPFDIVVDPFAGGGSTLDICKRRFRRCWASDRLPIEERQREIRKLDLVVDGLPDLRKRWSDVKLVYLDPPYWKQAEGQYSDDPTDLANMDINEFNKQLSGIIKEFGKKLSAGAVIALIIQPTQWNSPDRKFTDHVGDMLRLVKLPVDMRYSVPYESQQCNAQMVEWSKANKTPLVLTREIVAWRVG